MPPVAEVTVTEPLAVPLQVTRVEVGAGNVNVSGNVNVTLCVESLPHLSVTVTIMVILPPVISTLADGDCVIVNSFVGVQLSCATTMEVTSGYKYAQLGVTPSPLFGTAAIVCGQLWMAGASLSTELMVTGSVLEVQLPSVTVTLTV